MVHCLLVYLKERIMPNDFKKDFEEINKERPQDPSRINISQPWELQIWAKHFGVSEGKILQAVTTVGVMIKDIEGYFNRRL